jgi:hypothetical protein
MTRRDDSLRPSRAELEALRERLESLSPEQAEHEIRAAVRESRKRAAGREGRN